MENILEVKNVVKEYAAHIALNKVSVDIPKGCIFGLLGPNGAGKTSLIRIITGITRQDSGEVLFKGKPITTNDYMKIGYLPEERGLYKKMKVGEQLLYLTQLRGLSEAEARNRINHWAEKMELTKWLGKTVADLSKGMQQKVQFIATVIHEPELIILDEPFSGFDPLNANLLTNEILGLQQRGATIIFSTHRMETVEELCEHICMINKSKVVLNGAKAAIKKSYSTGSLVLLTESTLPSLAGVEFLATANAFEYVVNKPKEMTTNQLISQLLPTVEIRSIAENLPDMRQIFIDTVGADAIQAQIAEEEQLTAKRK